MRAAGDNSAEPSSVGVTVRLMGTIEAHCHGSEIVLAGQRVRHLLALLALSAGKPVPIDRIASCLWDEDPPENIRASVQTYIGRLRRAIGRAAISRLPDGYRLDVDRAAVDLLNFADRLKAAADAGEDQEYLELTSIIGSWTGAPFGNGTNPWFETYETPGWTERYLQAVERRADLDLLAGRYQECIVALADQVANFALRESLWARWLTALHRCGRTADALHQYETLRARIADELGVDPSAQLRDVHTEILSSDASARTPKPASRVTPSMAQPVPQSLPPGVRGFTGRHTELKELDTHLNESEGLAPGLVVLHGPGGVGKTSLALQWAQRARCRFPDGQIYLNLRGYGTSHPIDVPKALARLLQSLGVTGEQLPGEVAQRETLWRELMHSRRVLLILDNARDSGQVRPLLPDGNSFVVVTSRTQMRGLVSREAADRIAVDTMPEGDSVAMLTRRLRASQPCDEGLEELAELCGHLPLALAIAAEQVGRNTTTPLDATVTRLRDDRERLHQLRTGSDEPEANLRAVFDWSYNTLDDPAKQVFRLLGLAPAANLSTEAIAALAGLDTARIADLLDRLVDRHLLNEQQPGFYELHDLTRVYAGNLTEELDSVDERERARARMHAWYVHTAQNAAWLTGDVNSAVILDSVPAGVTPQEFDSSKAAFQWVIAHRRAISALMNDAYGTGNEIVYTLIPILSQSLGNIDGVHEEQRLNLMAFESARRSGDDRATALCAVRVGATYGRSHHVEEALDWLTWGRDSSLQIGYKPGELQATGLLAIALFMNDDAAGSIELLNHTIRDAHESGLELRQAQALNNLANIYRRLGRYVEAAERSIRVLDALDHCPEMVRAKSLDTLAQAWLGLKEYAQAQRVIRRVLELYGDVNVSQSHAIALRILGQAEHGLGNISRAKECWRAALAVLDRIRGEIAFDVTREELETLIEEASRCECLITMRARGRLPYSP